MEEIILTLQSSAKDEQGNDAVEDDDGGEGSIPGSFSLNS